MSVLARAAARIRAAAQECTLARFALGHPGAAKTLRRLARATLVTLDVFDTALLRVVAEPADVFALTAWRYALRRGRAPALDAFVAARREAESQARRTARAAGRGEVTLEEIYAALGARAAAAAERDGLRAEELASERDVSTPNPPFVDLFARLRARGAYVVFLSDTYLPEAFVANLLRAAGYAEPVRAFTSSTFGSTKADGGLYAAVARAAGIRVCELAHVGDNPLADVRNAVRAGARAFWYRRDGRGGSVRSRWRRSVGESGLAGSIVLGLARTSPRATAAQALAADVAAPLYLGFAQWLHASLETTRPDAILFCARDGLIAKRAYDRLCTFYPGAPRSIYFLVSRRTLVFPSFTQIGERELDFLCANPLPMSPQAYVERIGFDVEQFSTHLARAGLSRAQLITTADDRLALRRFFAGIADDVLRAAAAERALLLRYLDELGCAAWSRIAVCDIGWHGSLQRALTSLLHGAGYDVAVEGYYLGLSDRVAADVAPSMRGWLWSPDDGAQAMRTQSDGREVVEMFFTARHPTVIGRDFDGVRTYARFDRNADLDANNRTAAAAIQTAALAIIDAYVSVFDGIRPARIAREDVYARVRRLIERPRAPEIAFLGGLVHVAGFGTTRSGQPLARPPSALRAIRHPREFADAYRRARWPTGFLAACTGSWRFAAIRRGAGRLLRRLRGR